MLCKKCGYNFTTAPLVKGECHRCRTFKNPQRDSDGWFDVNEVLPRACLSGHVLVVYQYPTLNGTPQGKRIDLAVCGVWPGAGGVDSDWEIQWDTVIGGRHKMGVGGITHWQPAPKF